MLSDNELSQLRPAPQPTTDILVIDLLLFR
jgi:hypothetical protein